MSRRGGLGKGLDALLPEMRQGAAQSALREVPIESVRPNPQQPRRRFDDDAAEELRASVATLGILQPLIVRAVDDALELVAGERRLRAARAAGLQTVPVIVVETDDQGSLERALVENIHRADLNALEEAAALRQLLDDAGLTQEALGERLGRSRSAITNSLRLLELPAPVQALIAEGRLSGGHGKALLGLQGNPFQMRIARRAAEEGLSVRETEDLVRRFAALGAGSATRTGAAQRPPEAAEAQRRLAQHLQTRVRVDVGKRKGKIVLDFVSTDELERLVALITEGRF